MGVFGLLIKSTVINQTRFPIRRLDVALTVPYTENLSRVIQTLREVVAANQYALANPELFLNLKQFSLAGTDLSLGVWFDRPDMTDLKNSLMVEILDRFRTEGITLPRPLIDGRPPT